MEKKSNFDFSVKNYLNWKAIFILAGDYLYRFIYLIIGLYFFVNDLDLGFVTGWMWLGVLIFLLVMAYWYYRRFFFYVVGEELILEKGIFVHRKLSIKFDKIQHVNLEQGIMYQILDLYKVTIDTAGSDSKEFVLPGLGESRAVALKSLVLDGNHDYSETHITEQKREEKEIAKISLFQLVLSGLIGNPFRLGSLILTYIVTASDNFYELFKRYIDIYEIIENGWNGYQGMFLFILFIVFLLSSFFIQLITNVVRYYNYSLHSLKQFILLDYGLLRRISHSLNKRKVQLLRIRNNGLARWLDFSKTQLLQVSSAKTNVSKVESIPYTTPELEKWVSDWSIGRNISTSNQTQSHIIFGLRRGIILSLVLLVIMSVAYYYLQQISVFYLFIFFPLIIWYYYTWGKKAKYGYDNNLIVSDIGWWSQTRLVGQTYKAQVVKLRQSIFQKRRKTANLTISYASSAITFYEVDIELARKIYMMCMDVVNSNPSRAWM